MKILKKYPLFILTYQRPVHLQSLVQALLEDPASQEFKTYFFIDGLKKNATDKQRDNQQKIINIIRDYEQVRPTVFFIAEQNQGVFRSLKWGAEIILQDHPGFIYLEEDIVPKKGFLTYMDQSLCFYEKHPNVYAVNGFAFQEVEILVPPVYTAYRFCPWGFATYKQHWEEVHWTLKSIRWKKWSPFFWLKFHQDSWGWGWVFFVYTFVPFLRKKIQPWDILFFLHHYLGKRVSIWRKDSLVLNTGLDGSGLHAGVELVQSYNNPKIAEEKESCFCDEIQVNLKQNKKISQRLSPIFSLKSFKTAVNLLRKKDEI